VVQRHSAGEQSPQGARCTSSPVPAFKLLEQGKSLIALNYIAPMRVDFTYDALRKPTYMQQLHIPAQKTVTNMQFKGRKRRTFV
jgi:hypothetical protein